MERKTKEPQYVRLLEVADEEGVSQLGLMSNYTWHDDPKRLTFTLARYKFVSKMLSGRNKVLEIGCGDAFATRIVRQEVGALTAVDFDPVFIDDARRRQGAKWNIDLFVHDILVAPVPGQFDGIYSLDVMEHIPPDREDIYLKNIVASLAPGGAVMIGMPSLESQSYASTYSKMGHVNCKSGNDLRGALQKYFWNVFLFSMNDEMVHTGYAPMAHYLHVLCTEPKRGG